MITNEPQVNVTDIVFGKRPIPSTQESRSGYVNVDRGESSDSGIDLSNYYTKSEVDGLIEGIEVGKYVAGENIQISPDNVISATDTKYTASDFDIKDLADSTNLKYKWNNKQDTLTAGNNISIENNIISAEDPDLSEYYTKTEVNNIIDGIDIPEYTAGTNVSIDANNVISATDTTYTASDFDIKDLTDSTDLKSTWNNKQDKLTAGNNITIDSNNVISSTGGNGLKQVDLTTYADGVEGEIVQHIGNTTDEYIHGYIYKLSPGHVTRYEDITIPAGSKKLVYTNKFNQSIKRVYSYEQVTLSKYVNYGLSGSLRLYNLDQALTDSIRNSNSTYIIGDHATNLIPDGTDYAVMPFDQVTYYSWVTFDNIRSRYEGIVNRVIEGVFRYDVNQRSIKVRATGSIARMYFYLTLTHKDGRVEKAPSITAFYMIMSDLESRDWDVARFLSEVRGIPLAPVQGQDTFWFNMDEVNTIKFDQMADIVTDQDGNVFVAEVGGYSGAGTKSLYHVISDDGESEYYVDVNHNSVMMLGKPTDNSVKWANDIDGEIYFDYTYEHQVTSEPVTIRRKVTEYDEYGLPIDKVIGLLWNRIDVQPANQLTAGNNITIDSNNVISANLWTSITD